MGININSFKKKTVGEHIQYAIRAGRVPVRGVNLGGWLVVENWINSKDPLWYGVPSTVRKIKYFIKIEIQFLLIVTSHINIDRFSVEEK